MSLIICTECGKQFSDKAIACPNCACPTTEIIKDLNKASGIGDKDLVVAKITNNENVDIDSKSDNLIPSNPDRYFQNYMKVFKDYKIQMIKEYSRINGFSLIESKKIVDNKLLNIKWKKCLTCNVDLFDLDTFCINCGEEFLPNMKLNNEEYDALKKEYNFIQQLKSEYLYNSISKKEKTNNILKQEKLTDYKDNSIKCPRCGSNNYKVITGISKAASWALLGPFAAGKILSKYHCQNCKHNY